MLENSRRQIAVSLQVYVMTSQSYLVVVDLLFILGVVGSNPFAP